MRVSFVHVLMESLSECGIKYESVNKTYGILIYNPSVCNERSHIMNRNFTIFFVKLFNIILCCIQ